MHLAPYKFLPQKPLSQQIEVLWTSPSFWLVNTSFKFKSNNQPIKPKLLHSKLVVGPSLWSHNVYLFSLWFDLLLAHHRTRPPILGVRIGYLDRQAWVRSSRILHATGENQERDSLLTGTISLLQCRVDYQQQDRMAPIRCHLPMPQKHKSWADHRVLQYERWLSTPPHIYTRCPKPFLQDRWKTILQTWFSQT